MSKPKPLLVSLLVAVALVPVAVACGSKPPNPPTTPTTPDAGGGDAGWLPLVDGGPMDAGPPDGGGPIVSPTLDAGVSNEAQDGAIDLAIKAAAAKVAPKMEPEGQPGRATLAPNERFNMMVMMQPNRCYTIVGFSPAGGVTQLDLKLMAPPYTIVAGQSGAADKNQPVIGKADKALCPILPLAIAYRIDALAMKGTGRIGVQVFSRAK